MVEIDGVKREVTSLVMTRISALIASRTFLVAQCHFFFLLAAKCESVYKKLSGSHGECS